MGKLLGKASRESHRSLDPREWKRDTAATAREESASACSHSRRGLTPLGRLQKYPKIHVSTVEESSGSGTDSTQGLRPRHRRERNPERPPSNSHGDSPFLRPPERVPRPRHKSRAPAATRENPGGFPSRRDEAHFRSGVSQARSDSSFLGREPKSKASLGKASPRPSSLAPETLPDRGSEQS